MGNELTALFRSDAIHHDEKQGASAQNPGGGLSTKKKHLAKALPKINFIEHVEDMADITIVDVLYFSGGKTLEDKLERIDNYRKHKGVKILWTSDLEILRTLPEHRALILEATDCIAANSTYMLNLLSGCLINANVVLLTDPIDTASIESNTEREPIIYSCSQVLLEKGIDDIISLYKGLSTGTYEERQLQRLFIGSSESWGVTIRDTDSFDLEMQLESVCDHQWSLTNEEVMAIARKALFYISFARYESFGYSVTEALLGGCHVFTRKHLAYQDRIDAGVVTAVDNPLDLRHKIKEHLAGSEPFKRNDAGIQYVHDNYSLPVFRRQFKDIVGEIYGI